MTAGNAASVWVSPARLSGVPCIYGHRITVIMVAQMTYRDGVAAAEGIWMLSRKEVLGGCWYMAVHGPKKWRRRWGDWAETNAGPLWLSDYDAVPDPPVRCTPTSTEETKR